VKYPEDAGILSHSNNCAKALGGRMEKGTALGTVLAFIMSVVGLSLPEMVILRWALKLQLIVG
jgi:uncharacterized membrane protein YraQ (UPF0718 family)